MKILIVGATGIIGRQLLPMIREHGFEPVALSHSSTGRTWLDKHQYAHVQCDVFDPISINRAFEEVKPDVVVNQLTSLPKSLNPRRLIAQLAATNSLRSVATPLLVQAAGKIGAGRVISQSIAFAYAPRPGAAAVESDKLFNTAPSGFDRAVAAINIAEAATLNAPGLKGIVLRYGHFCGPQSAYAPGGATHETVKAGRMPLVGSGSGSFSFIHVRDAAMATVCALDSEASGVYNIVDDTPVQVAEWLPWYATRTGAGKPARVPAWLARLLAGRFAEHMMITQMGASNERARRELQWSPRFATWQAGLGDSIQTTGGS